MLFYPRAKLKMVKKEKNVNTKIKGHTVKLLLNTGSDISIVNELNMEENRLSTIEGYKKLLEMYLA